MIKEEYKNGCRLKEQVKYNIDYDDCQILNLTCANYIYDLVQESSKYETKLEDVKKMLYMIEKLLGHEVQLDQNFSGVNNKFNINREDINLISSIRNNTLVKDIVKYIDYEDIPTLNMVANLGGVFIEYIKGKPVISGDMYVSKMGTTQERPANIINKGFQYFDTTINKPIFWDGAKWIDATGATV